jgi:hypothetical protein
MKTNIEYKFLKLLSEKEFSQLSEVERNYVLGIIKEEEYSFFKKILIDKKITKEITPDKTIKLKLDNVLRNKNKKQIQFYRPISVAASVIIIATFIFLKSSNLNSLSSSKLTYRQLNNYKITSVLLNIGRIENQSFKIVPSFNTELESSGYLNKNVSFQ